MKLVGSLTSPYVRKVRVFLAEKKLDYQFILDDVHSEASIISQYNPLGKVPCLLLDGKDGVEAIFDSRVIVAYLDTIRPGGRLISESGRERALIGTWEALADGVLDAAISIYCEMTWAGRKKGERSSQWVDWQMVKINNALTAMEKAVGASGYCVGNAFSLADIAVGSTLGYLDFRFPDIAWHGRFPRLDKLNAALQLRASFMETQPRSDA